MQNFELLTQSQIEQIHEATLEVMEQIGIDFKYKKALEILSKGGANVDGFRVRFPRKMVEAQLRKVPSEFTLYARNPEHNLIIGGDQHIHVPANCAPFVTDLDKGRRYGTFDDFENLVKLTHASQNLNMLSNILVEPNDVSHELRPAKTIYACLRLSDKCFMGSAIDPDGARHTLQMISIVFGEKEPLTQKPRVIAIPCSLTPLCYDENMLGVMIEYAKAGQPQLINSLTIGGATAPATLAGALVVQNAEILAGIVFAELVREGTPVVYAMGSSCADMRSGTLSVGAPEMSIHNVMAAQMARFYKIPSRGVGTLTDSKTTDMQAGYESMMNLMAAHNGGVNFILHATGSLETINCVSYEKFIIDDEMVGMMNRISRGVQVTQDSLALEVIAEAGPGGQFLDKMHTFEHCRNEFFLPRLSDRKPYESWEKAGAISIQQIANQKWKDILEQYQPPDFPESVDKDLKKYMTEI
ncbi:MAG: trimethylamine methyltransferase family protein [Desulfobacterales bacterium]|nr:trimethylamine methyltransferase family protein [Desulfobacterales bacterium]